MFITICNNNGGSCFHLIALTLVTWSSSLNTVNITMDCLSRETYGLNKEFSRDQKMIPKLMMWEEKETLHDGSIFKILIQQKVSDVVNPAYLGFFKNPNI